MKKENHIKVLEFWTRHKIPYVFDETLSLYQLVRLTIRYLNEVIKDQNELKDIIKEFIQAFEEDLQDTVIEILEKWKDDGSLKEIINQALFESKLDKSEFIAYKQDQMKLDVSQNNKIDNINNELKIIKSRLYDIRDYNLSGDITKGLQNLVNLVSSNGGGTIYIPNGEYTISKTEMDKEYGVILKSNVNIIGESKNAILKVGNFRYGNGVLYADDKENIVINNLTIDGDLENIEYKSSIVRFRNSKNITVKNVVFKNIAGGALYISGSKHSLFENIIFINIDGNEKIGSGVGGQCFYAENLKNSVINNINAYNIGDHVVYLDNSLGDKGENYTISNVYVNGTGLNGVTNGSAINICNTQENFTINNVHIDSAKTGIRIANNGGRNEQPKFFNISNIHINKTTEGAGIYIAGGNENSRARMNGNINSVTIKNTGSDSITSSPFGIRAQNVSNINFSNIVINNTALSGIVLMGIGNISFDNVLLSYVATKSKENENHAIRIAAIGSLNKKVSFRGLTVEGGADHKTIMNACELWLMDFNFNVGTVENYVVVNYVEMKSLTKG